MQVSSLISRVPAREPSEYDFKFRMEAPANTPSFSGIVAYPASADSSKFCSWSRTNCIDGDIGQNTPQGYAAITFDDGPTPYSADLGKFLADNKQSSTHFLIGSAILNNPDAFAEMIKYKDLMQFGIHTTTHSLQTTKTDLQIVADLGWTAQMIYDATGLVPLYWRAPEGDVDVRVRAIAKEVFGLQHVIWNRDTDDWCMNPSGGPESSIETCKTQSFDKVTAVYKGWAHNSSLEGINVLMHETKPSTVNAFKSFYAELKGSKYKIGSVADVLSAPAYQNQFATSDPVEKAKSIMPTREPIDYADGGMHQVGTSGGAKLGDFASLKTASSSSGNAGLQAGSGSGNAVSSPAGSGSSSGASSGSSSSTSGARLQFVSSPILLLGGVATSFMAFW